MCPLRLFFKILNIYAVSFYGSGLWNLFSADCERLYSAWNVAIRHAWNIPNTTHRYLVESISGSLHPKVMLASRYSSFANSLIKEKMKYFPVPPQESRRIGFLTKLFNSNLGIPGFNTDEVDEMVSHLCKS